MTMLARDFRALFPEFDAPSWQAWNAIEDSIFAQPSADTSVVLLHTRRATLPSEAVSEFWAIAGRGAGKSRFCGRLACYVACCREYRRVAGESIYIGVFGPDKKQAAVTYRYVVGLLHSVPALASLIVRETAESIELSTGIVIEVIAATVAAPRGRAYALVIVEEAAFLPDDSSADADRELLRAVRPALARVPGSLLAVISSPYAMRGELFRTWQTKYSKDDPHVLVLQADTLSLNPSFSTREIERAFTDDPASAAAEYGAEFRNDVADFFDAATLARCIATGIKERPADLSGVYCAHFDGATGSQSAEDAAALSIARAGDDGRAVQVAVRLWQPPFSPLSVVTEAAQLLARYGVDALQGDRFAPGIFADLFRQNGVEYSVSPHDTSQTFIELLALVNSGTVELLDDDVQHGQLRNLERRTRPGGHDRVGHRSRAHDDVAAACAGSLVLAAAQLAEGPPLMLIGGATYREWEQARGGWPEPQPDDGSDEGGDEVIEATEEEMAARPDAADWVRADMAPRRERQKRHHAEMLVTVERDGYWDPRDER